jgi:hypothetical protein
VPLMSLEKKNLDEQDLMEFIWLDLDSKCGRY